MADTPISVGTGSLNFTGGDAYYLNSGDCKLVITGYAPVVVLADTIVQPTTGALAFTGYAPSRPFGLEITGYAPTLKLDHYATPTTGTITFAGKTPQSIIAAPPSVTISPATGSIAFTGVSASLNVLRADTLVGSLAFTGYAPNANISAVTAPVYPFFARLVFTGYAPTVLIEGSGTSITNKWATTDVPTNYQIDDRTGFKIKVKDPMVKDYTGHYMRPESADIRSEQEFIRSKPERQRGPLRPEPVGNERFIDEEYPNGVDADDL